MKFAMSLLSRASPTKTKFWFLETSTDSNFGQSGNGFPQSSRLSSGLRWNSGSRRRITPLYQSRWLIWGWKLTPSQCNARMRCWWSLWHHQRTQQTKQSLWRHPMVHFLSLLSSSPRAQWVVRRGHWALTSSIRGSCPVPLPPSIQNLNRQWGFCANHCDTLPRGKGLLIWTPRCRTDLGMRHYPPSPAAMEESFHPQWWEGSIFAPSKTQCIHPHHFNTKHFISSLWFWTRTQLAIQDFSRILFIFSRIFDLQFQIPKSVIPSLFTASFCWVPNYEQKLTFKGH